MSYRLPGISILVCDTILKEPYLPFLETNTTHYIEVFNAVNYVNLPERGPPIADPHLGKRRENICNIH